jgi:hypothetical protein
MSTPSQEEITPNQYHLHGGDISVSYYPEELVRLSRDVAVSVSPIMTYFGLFPSLVTKCAPLTCRTWGPW